MGNTILLADKSITIQKIVQLTFADDNYQIHCVSDGQTALEAIPKVRPDLILADISLPLKSGYDICSTLRNDLQYSEFSDVPVILLAGIYETMDEERARIVEEKVREVQASDFLSKPFDPQLLISKVKQYISGTGQDFVPDVPMFPPEADSAINLFDTESAASSVPPVDDNEKTMMLPGGPFGSMFAESLPQDNGDYSSKPVPPVDVENINPVGEVVFNEDEFPQVVLGAEEEDQQPTVSLVQPKTEDLGQAFSGREEQEFEYAGSDLDESQPNSIPLVLPETEPFGDVFQEPAQGIQWSAPASEEDSPFGLPEPPPPPAPEPVLFVEPPADFIESPIPEEPIAATERLETGFDDTWPGVPMKMNIGQPVEELFESEVPASPSVEDVEELEPDLSEGIAELSDATPSAPVVFQTSASSAQVTEELIERIAEKVINKLSERVVSEIVWQVVPDLAEKMIRRELEKLHAGED